MKRVNLLAASTLLIGQTFTGAVLAASVTLSGATVDFSFDDSLLGLFGTVVGMIEIFGAQTAGGTNPAQLAHGISIALYNTAFGLIVAIPAMAFYRHFRRKVESLVVDMEQQAIKLVEIVHGERD